MSGIRDEMGTGTPLLYTYPGMITVSQVIVEDTLNVYINPLLPYG